jgi:streptomycin 6-kinase
VITVPEQFVEWRTRVDGEAGRRWVRSLPVLVDRLVDQWDLIVEDTEPLHGALSLVVLVRRDDRPLALRLCWPDDTNTDEARALRAWQGRGMVALEESDPDACALLLERLDHRRSLHTLPLWAAAEVAGALIRTLAVRAPADMRTLGEVAAGMPDRLIRSQQALGKPIPARWIAAASRHAAELDAAGEQVLIHADLHYGNVLAARRRPWLAIDPRPLAGTPEYSVPELMWNRADELHTDSDVWRLFDILVKAADLDRDLASGWVITRCVDYWLWGLQRGLTIDPARCARILNALSPRPAI